MSKLDSIIQEAKKGKRQAQNHVMDMYWNSVFNYVYHKINDEEEAEDIAIETFTKVFAKLKLYNSDFDFKTWILSIAHNTMVDHIRKSPALKLSLDDENYPIDIEEALPSPEESLIQQQDSDALMRDIQKLKPEYRRILELRFLEEKTYKEIAADLDLTLANVKVRILRARQLLQEILKD